MHKYKNIAAWLGIMAYIVFSVSFTAKKTNHVLCSDIKVNIPDSLQVGFVTVKDVQQIIENTSGRLRGTPIDEINTAELEETLREIRSIAYCEVYKTLDGKLMIDISQRQPVLRIIDQNQDHFYIDTDGYIVPYTPKHVPHVLIANGFISTTSKIDFTKQQHVSDFNEAEGSNILNDLYKFSMFVHQNEFWKNQFVQIYVNKKEEIDLIPRVGAHIIILGAVDGFESKLIKLKTLYNKAFKNVGWNEYETINLKYKHQVVCTKR